MASEEMRALLDGFRDQPKKGKSGTIEEQRALTDQVMADQPLPDGILIDDFTLAGRPARKYFMPDVREDATLLYLHGGGYRVGSLDSHHALSARLSVACETAVNSIAYRLAPEHPYPAALDDAIAAYKEMLQYTAAEKIMIAGDSAGGGLALASLIRIRDEGLPMAGCAALLSPNTDLTYSGVGMQESHDQFMRDARLYAGDNPLDTPGISPVYGEMMKLPPLLIQVASDEFLVTDSTRVAERAEAAGVSVDLQQFDDAFHVFQAFTQLPESQDALSDIGAFYKRHI